MTASHLFYAAFILVPVRFDVLCVHTYLEFNKVHGMVHSPLVKPFPLNLRFARHSSVCTMEPDATTASIIGTNYCQLLIVGVNYWYQLLLIFDLRAQYY